MLVRRAEIRDFDAIVSLDVVAESQERGRISIQRWIDANDCYVAIDSAEVIGYAALEYTFYDNAFIPMLYVASEHRHKEIATALIHHLESLAATEKIFTSTNESNVPMQSLLSKLGYKPSGIIENLDEGDPELIFFKRLR